LRSKKEDISETSKNCCNECGGMMNEEGMCNECGSMMNESKKKKTLRLTESELVILIEKMVKESSIPTVTKRAQSETKKDNDSNIVTVGNKMKDYLTIPGNSNPKFPHQNKKGDNVKVSQTSEEEDKITDERGRGMENLNYDHEPSEKFKDRLKKALEGDSTMGNGQDAANVVKSDLGKKVEKEVVRKKEDKEKEPLYKKERVPVSVNESEEKSKQILKEEIEKMKALSSYNKKTQ
jgi:competence protein ComGC